MKRFLPSLIAIFISLPFVIYFVEPQLIHDFVDQVSVYLGKDEKMMRAMIEADGLPVNETTIAQYKKHFGRNGKHLTGPNRASPYHKYNKIVPPKSDNENIDTDASFRFSPYFLRIILPIFFLVVGPSLIPNILCAVFIFLASYFVEEKKYAHIRALLITNVIIFTCLLAYVPLIFMGALALYSGFKGPDLIGFFALILFTIIDFIFIVPYLNRKAKAVLG